MSARDSLPTKGPHESEVENLFRQHAERLKRSVKLHIDPRLSGRIDPSDIVQEVFLEAASRYDEYQSQPTLPPFLWLRFLTIQRLALVHRTNLGVKARDVRREMTLCKAGSGAASAASLAAVLVGYSTSPSQVVSREERRERVQRSLAAIDPLDREVLLRRHFEQLSNQETAQALELSETAASKRYIRALSRMKKLLAGLSGSSES
jgi:RNA polymerase sigma-70 factor (ECF subfamily)